MTEVVIAYRTWWQTYTLIKGKPYFIDFCQEQWVGESRYWCPYEAKRGKSRYVTDPLQEKYK